MTRPSDETNRKFQQLALGIDPSSVRNVSSIVGSGAQHATSVGDFEAFRNWTRDGSSGLWAPYEPLQTQPIDYLGTFLTLEDYFPSSRQIRATELVDYFLEQIALDELLDHLSELNAVLSKPSLMEQLSNWFLSIWAEPTRTRLELVYAERPRVHLIHRRNVLLAMRTALSKGHRQPKRAPEFPSLLIAIFLVHAVDRITMMEQQRITKGSLEGSELLLMDVVQNWLFSSVENPLARMDRQLRLWKEHGPLLEDSVLRSDPASVFVETSGLEIEDFLAFGFGLLTLRMSWTPGQSVRQPALLHKDVPGKKLERFLERVSLDADDFQRKLQAPQFGDWDFMTLYQRPILRSDSQLLILDTDLLINRITDGTFYDLLDSERDRGGEKASNAWMSAYGQMIESMVREQLRGIALQDLHSNEPMMYSEEDPERRPKTGKIADVILPYGGATCLIEIHGGQIHRDTRFRGSWKRLQRDTEKMIIEKAEQLNDTVDRLIMRRNLPDELKDLSTEIIVPVIVSGGGYPVNPITTDLLVRPYLKGRNLLQRHEVTELCVVSLRDLEALEALCSRGESLLDLLIGWKSSHLRNMPLFNYIEDRFMHLEPAELRPARIGKFADSALIDIARRLGFSVSGAVDEE